MQRKNGLALFGVLVLALSVTIGMTVGAAEAKKKGKKKGATKVTVTAPPAGIPAAPMNQQSFTSFNLTVGKKAKGKVVANDSVAVTFKLTGTVPGEVGHLGVRLYAPNGRALFLGYPDDHDQVVIGPVRLTANSPAGPCLPDPTPPPPPCNDPDLTLPPPYAGTLGATELSVFEGVPAKGTWRLRFSNFVPTETFTASDVKLEVPLASK